jgi:hypothetical protein
MVCLRNLAIGVLCRAGRVTTWPPPSATTPATQPGPFSTLGISYR